MNRHFLLASTLLFSTTAMTGCTWIATGFDNEVEFERMDNLEIQYGYIAVESDPPDAIVSVWSEWKIVTDARAGFDARQLRHTAKTTEWTVLGSTPVLNAKWPTQMTADSRDGLATADFVVALSMLSLRFEKPGYETLEISNFLPREQEQRRPTLKVTLTPESEDENENENENEAGDGPQATIASDSTADCADK